MSTNKHAHADDGDANTRITMIYEWLGIRDDIFNYLNLLILVAVMFVLQ